MRKQTKLVVALSATALLALGASAVTFAAGWDNSTGEWQYLDSNGDAVTDTWKKNGDYWFYLGDDGNMVRNQVVEDTTNATTRYYFVDEDGVMATNTWKAVELNGDENSDIDAEYWWYYFGNDGKAYTSKDNLTQSEIKTINGQKYAFDDQGHMLYGWINEETPDQQDDNDTAWQDAKYYFNGWNDGHMATGWQQISVVDDDDTETYWFYFGSDGKKTANKVKKIGGVKYNFGENGNMLDDWAAGTASSLTGASTSSIVYLNGDGSQRKNTWIYAVPDEDWDQTNYDDDEYKWWYFGKNGQLYNDAIKKINGKYYAFDNMGEMINKFVSTSTGSKDGNVQKEVDEDNTTRNEYIAMDFTGKDLYFFSADYDKDGSMAKGYTNVDLEDDTYQFYFNTSTGIAKTEYNSKIKKYTVNGLVMKPTNDDDSNYMAVEVDNAKTTNVPSGDVKFGRFIPLNDNYVLVSKTGAITKGSASNNKIIKDSNDEYYVVDENGVVVYWNAEKIKKTTTTDATKILKTLPNGEKIALAD